jgi:bifunctional non-homologous end joining protein LigD
VRAQGLEGLVAKRLDSSYEPGQRSGAWQKMRLNRGKEFVIAGYTPSAKNFDALAFGYYRRRRSHLCGKNAQWLYAGLERTTV